MAIWVPQKENLVGASGTGSLLGRDNESDKPSGQQGFNDPGESLLLMGESPSFMSTGYLSWMDTKPKRMWTKDKELQFRKWSGHWAAEIWTQRSPSPNFGSFCKMTESLVCPSSVIVVFCVFDSKRLLSLIWTATWHFWPVLKANFESKFLYYCRFIRRLFWTGTYHLRINFIVNFLSGRKWHVLLR